MKIVKPKILVLIGVAAIAVTVIPLSLNAADDFKVGQQCWEEGRYRDAYTHLWRYRQTPYGRSAYVDYMLGTSGCRLDDLRQWGCDVLEWMLSRYALSEQGRSAVRNELALCRSTSSPGAISPPGVATTIASMVGASARSSAKSYYWIGKDEQFNSYPAYRVREISKQELEARLIPIGARGNALHETQQRTPGFEVVVYEHFVLASRSGHSRDTMDRMAKYLEQYIRFLERQYSVSLPKTFVTVYMVPTSDDLIKHAERLHGLRVSRVTFGYSFRDDMSVIVAIPNEFLIGTIMHELFHLAVRSNFGDIPQWLDEGMAGLYEVSKFQSEEVLGIPNWRGKVLASLMHRRPTVKQLVVSDWFAFEQVELATQLQSDQYNDSPPAEQMAAMLATARYFTFYLQEKGKLKLVFQDLQKLTPGNGSGKPAQDSIKILEEHLGKKIDLVDEDFLAWFRRTE